MSRVSWRVLLTATILLMPIAAYAQEAVMTGTVSDSTGGVLPGVTVTALLEATGNTFVAVTEVDSSSLGGNIDPRQVQEMPVQDATGVRCCCSLQAAVPRATTPTGSIRGTPTVFASFRPTSTDSSFRTRWAAAVSRRSARR